MNTLGRLPFTAKYVVCLSATFLLAGCGGGGGGSGGGPAGAPALFGQTAAVAPTDPLIAITESGHVLRTNGDGAGNFAAVAELESLGGCCARSGIISDFDEDGIQDIVASSGVDNVVNPFFYKGKNDGTYAAKVALATTPNSGGYGMDACGGDFNDDGHADFIVGTNGPTVGFYFGDGKGGFTQETRTFAGLGRGMDSGDFNEDGFLDFARARCCDGLVELNEGDGTGKFNATQIANVGGDPYGLAAADFDDDGHVDLIVGGSGNGDPRFIKGNGDGTFAAPAPVPSADFKNYSGYDAYDYNRDGAVDLVGVNYSGRDLLYLPGNGDGTFGAAVLVGKDMLEAVLGVSAAPLPKSIDLEVTPATQTIALNGTASLQVSGTGLAGAGAIAWTFGDGASGSGASVSHVYAKEGVFLPYVNVTAADGFVRRRAGRVQVNGNPPVANAGGPYALGEAAANQDKWTAALDGTKSTDDFGIVTYSWDFGDGQTGAGATVSHTWANRGPWTVKLTVTDAAGQTATDTKAVTFTPGAPPVAKVSGPTTVDETFATNGQWTASYNASASTDDFGIWRYEWTFGDGGTGTGASPSHTWGAAGSFKVTVTVFDNANQSSAASLDVTVKASAPPVPKIAGPTKLQEDAASNGCWKSTWDATGSTDDRGIWKVLWDFGDGSTSTDLKPSHNFCGAGTYTVKLTVFDFGGQSVTISQDVVVSVGAAPVAKIAINPSTVEGHQPFQLSGLGSTDDFGIVRYDWALPPLVFPFTGTTISLADWTVSDGATQNDQLMLTGTNQWGNRYFFSQGTTGRGSALQVRVQTAPDNGTYCMVGFKNTGGGGSYTDLNYGFYFNTGTLTVYENGGARGNFGAYTLGSTYDVRVETLPGAGARYLYKLASDATFTKMFESANLSDATFRYGAMIYAGTWSFDDFRIEPSLSGAVVTASTGQTGPVKLTVTDNAGLTGTATTTVTVVKGAPPVAVADGPDSLGVGIDGRFSGVRSTDDHAVAQYQWDFGDGSTSSGSELTHFYTATGTKTVTLTVFDYAGQSSSATLKVKVTGQNLVRAVPWHVIGDRVIPHDVLSGKPARLKAVAGAAAVPVKYTWDFGDGSPVESGTADTLDKAYNIEALHAYTGSDGTPFTAKVSIEDASGSVSTDDYLVIIRDKNIQVEMNVAIDEGLWYLHHIINRTNITPSIRGGNWNDQGYTISATSSALQAFEINGHLPLGDAARDPYIEDVTRGLNHLFTQLVPYSIGVQPAGDPDTNGNGIGLSGDSGGRPIYETGQLVDGLVAASAPDMTAPVGGANVIGRPIRDIVQDCMDQFYWGQYDDPSVGGGWRYGWNNFPDNSACQWASIAAIPAHDILGVPIPQWVKDQNLIWLNFSSTSDGFGYTGRGSGYGTTPSGMVQLVMDDVPTSDPLWKNGENFIARNWTDFLNNRNFYGFYAFSKAMRLVKPVPKTTLDLTGLNWFLDPAQGMARTLIDLQFADGHWRSNAWSTEPLSTAWGVIILSASLFQKPPVAIIHASPNPGAAGQKIHFDGTPSFHLDATKTIVTWQWDFDNRDGVNFDQPDATGSVVDHAFPALGNYTVSLRVVDDAQPAQVATTQVEIQITIPPHPPTAVPGGPYLAAVGEPVVLDGTGSFDIDQSFGDKVKSWGWEIKNKQPRDFADATGPTPTIPAYTAEGVFTIGLRVTDDTAKVFPQAGSPDLTDDAFTEITVYKRVIDDLAARAKDDKIQLTWSPRGFPDFQVFRSDIGPNEGFQKIASTSTQFSTYLDQGIELGKKYFYRIYAFEEGDPATPTGISSSVVVISSARTRNPNHRPKITTVAPLVATAGDLYVYDVDATDQDGDPITFLLDQGPAGMAIDKTTGKITFTPADDQVGKHTVFVEADDPKGGIDSQIYDLVVRPRGNQRPVAKANGPYAALAGTPITFSSAGSFDPDGDPITIQWAFGDGQTSSESNPTHTYTASGQYVATVFVRDDRGGLGTNDAKVQIDEPNRPPVAVAGSDVILRLGETLHVDGSKSSDPDGDPLSFTWNFGDSTPAVSGETADHDYASEGTFVVSLTVTDGRGGMGTAEFTATVGVANGAPVAVAKGGGFGNVGIDLTFDATGTSDPDGDPMSFSWDFGDGTSTSGLIVTHHYAAPGDYTATFTAKDNHGGVGTATVPVHINAPPVFTTTPPTSVLEDALFSYAPAATDADGDPVTFALITGPAGMTFDGLGTLLFTAGKTDIGDHPVKVRASDGKGGTADQSFTLTVVHVNHDPKVLSSPPLATDQFALYAYDVQASDQDDGDVLTFALTTSPPGMTIGSATGQVRWTPGKDDKGPHAVALLVTDGHGGKASQSWTLTVNEVNLAPKITSSPVLSATEHQAYAYQVTADDPNGDKLNFSLATAPAGMTINGGTGLIAWTPDVAHPPTAAVKVVVDDGRGLSDSQSFTITITNVNDPPVFTSVPVTGAVVAQAYSYQAKVTDEDGDAIAFTLLTAPAGMTIGGSTGLVSFTPPAGSEGPHAVTIQADDGHGGKTPQSYTLNVKAANQPPVITSTAVVSATEDSPYSYAVKATDPDGDAVNFALTVAPSGMTIDPATGVISWSPVKADVGPHPVTVTAKDQFGAQDSQGFTVTVAAVNHAPTITSTAPLAGDVGIAYSYAVTASDPENDAITFSLLKSPTGMTVNGSTGVISWTPTLVQKGPNDVSIQAADSHGASTHQDFTVTVADLTHAPVVSAIPGQTVQDPKAFATIALDGFVNDPDNTPAQMTWKVTGNVKLTVSVSAARVATITYAPGTRATELLTFTATDPDGLTGSTQASFTVAAPSNDKIPPDVAIDAPEAVAKGSSALIKVFAQDNEGISSVSLLVDGAAVTLTSLGNGAYSASFTGSTTGLHLIEASVVDLAGNTTSRSAKVLVFDSSIVSTLTAAITAPAEGAEVKKPTPVMGSASANTGFADYVLEYAPQGSSSFTQFAEGTSQVTNGTLGSFDPTLVANGLTTIRLTVRSLGGQTSSATQTVLVTGENKPGNFSITFTDLTVPVSGLPLVVKRTYDSRNRGTSMDFGFGWKVQVLSAGTYTNNRKPGDGWNVTQANDFLHTPCSFSAATKFHVTEIRFSDTEFYRFALQVNMDGFGSSIGGGCDGTASFVQVGGVPGATLDIIGSNDAFWANESDEVVDLDTFDIVEPQAVRLTTIDGREFDLELQGGVTRIGDPNGNSLFISSNGVNSTGGTSVTFVRDGQGRITQIKDPMGNSLDYTYDSDGNLQSATDRANNTTTFTYRFGHYLQDIVDPLGHTPIRNIYDDQGRVVKQIDASGHEMTIDTDAAAGTTTVTNRLGFTRSYEYNDEGLITTATAEDATVHFTYDANGHPLTRTDAVGNVTTYAYDAQGNIVTEKDPLGKVTTYTWTGGKPATLGDPSGGAATFNYDAKGNLLEAKDAGGKVVQALTYDAKGNATGVSVMGGSAQVTYDPASGNPTHQVGPGGMDRTITYDANGNALSQGMKRTTSGGVVTDTTHFAYDANGNITSSTDPEGNVTTFTYGPFGDVLTRKDPLGHVTTYVYDERGNLSKVTYADGKFEAFGYDLENRKTAQTDRSSHTTFYEYNGKGNLVGITYADGAAITNAYDAAGRITTVTDSLGHVITYQYDAADHRTAVTDPAGKTTQFTYTATGAVATMKDPLGRVTSYTYDGANFGAPRVTGTTLPDGHTRGRTYADSLRIGSQTDENGKTTSYEYDGAGHLTKVTDPLGKVTSYAYDEVGNRVSQTNANGHTTTFEYDGNRAMTKRTLPLGMSETFTYDAAGQVITHTDFNGNTITYTYDAVGRVAKKDLGGGVTETYTYTPSGRVESVTDAHGLTSFTYDARDRITQVDSPEGTVQYAYDLAGNRTSVGTAAGTTSYTYDALNRLSQVTDPQNGVTSYTYDFVGNMTSIAYPNGATRQYSYDPQNRVVSILDAGPGGTLAEVDYTRGPNGQVVTATEQGVGSVNYTYDATGRLLSEADTRSGSSVTTSYSYDAVGNRLSMTQGASVTAYTYDANDRLMSAGSDVYTYDQNGNTLSRTTGAGKTQYSYDAMNRLIGQVGTDSKLTTFTYDALGTRVARNADGVITRFLADVVGVGGIPRLVALLDAGHALIADYVWGLDLISQRRGAQTSYYHHDQNGSVRVLSDAGGAASETYRYDAFGNLLSSTGSVSNPFLFAGEEQDDALDMYYLRARYMDPSTGRFISGDPILGNVLEPRTLNRYSYGSDDPVNRVDPMGTQDFCMASISISISIVGTLSSIAIAGYGIYKDVKEVYDKLKELTEEIPKLKLNEKLTRAELRYRIIEINVSISKGIDIKLDNHLGDGSVGKSYEIVKDLVGGWGGKIVAFIWSYSAGEYMAEVLPEVDHKPGYYLDCEFNQYLYQTFQLGIIGGLKAAKFAAPALQVIGCYLAYFNFLELMVSTLGELSGEGAPGQPASGCCKVP